MRMGPIRAHFAVLPRGDGDSGGGGGDCSCNYACNEKYGNVSTNIMLVAIVYFIRFSYGANIHVE